jgi:hypothetical protein
VGEAATCACKFWPRPCNIRAIPGQSVTLRFLAANLTCSDSLILSVAATSITATAASTDTDQRQTGVAQGRLDMEIASHDRAASVIRIAMGIQIQWRLE